VLPEHAFVTTEVINNRSLAVLLAQNVPEPDPLSVPCLINSNSPDDLVSSFNGGFNIFYI
jgi:hypothetical protein